MLRQRVIVTIVLLPIGMAAIYFGGWYYITLIALLLGIASWEYVHLFNAGGYQPAGVFVVGGTLAFVVTRSYFGTQDTSWLVSLLTLASMTYHLFAYERKGGQGGTNFAITLAGSLYIGGLGSFLILLRNLPEGLWWTLLTLPIIWLADSGAYFYGRSFGRTPLSPRLSPKKTWEGYIAGIIAAVLGGAAFAFLWSLPAGPATNLTPLRGSILGLIISVVAPLGDLGESMIKRQVNIKDSSNLIPGHGGALDRIDSWLWAGAIGYYMIHWFFL